MVRGVDPREAGGTDSAPAKPSEHQTETIQGDRLELSLPARTAASSLTQSAQAPGKIGELSAERAAQIRQRIGSDYYNSPAVLNETVDNILNFYAE
jgi:hypothetical protein